MDFYKIKVKEQTTKKETLHIIYPEFKVGRSKDLMVQGKTFYAVWDEEKGLWSTDEYDVQRLVDDSLHKFAKERSGLSDYQVSIKTMSDFSTNSWLSFRNYMSHVSDNAHQLDSSLAFSNTEVKKTDYVSKRLPYPLEKGSYQAYDEIIGTLYSTEERAKLEWAIGAIVAGEAKNIQKFIVLYGDAGAGKSTILNIIQKLFEGYYTVFEAKALTSNSNAFSTEVFKNNPLVAIQHDGDLSKIEDNTKLNSIVSHEEIIINEKYKSSYSSRVNCFLFMATNRPVKITDAKSGIIRRLIDVKPSGDKIPPKRYQTLMYQVDFELGAIAEHCKEVYQKMGKNYYSTYRPVDMMYKTDPFFNFVEDSYETFKKQDGTSLKAAYAIYKQYCDDSGADYKLQMYKFREELKNYFSKFEDVARIDDKLVRSYYSGFRTKKFIRTAEQEKEEKPLSLVLDAKTSIFDVLCSDCPAQYATSKETPIQKWDEVTSVLKDIDTRKLHYVKVPKNHIVIDFDIKDETGKKSLEKNLEAASKFPPTYAELSKGGCGIHLHYIYDGDVTELSRLYDDDIEIKLPTGNSSLRRKLTKCNHIPVATINSGLPLKPKGDRVVNFEGVKTEKGLRTSIKKGLNKEVHAATKPSIDFIYKILDDAYNEGMKYDVSDMRPAISAFAASSTHQALYCIKMVNNMKMKSEEPSDNSANYVADGLIFYDVEVFPNLFIVCWKREGENHKPVRMINPLPTDIENLLKHKLVGFNCRRYDNHMMYARMMGYTNEQLYNLSQRIISGSRNAFFSEAYNLSYTDVYDFASAGNKKSLKKFEIELGIHHQENSYPWDEPLAEEHWDEVAGYCCNDVIATEETFHHLSADWTARQILADLAGMTLNDTTNTLTTKIIFGNNRKPQDQFQYRNLAEPVHVYTKEHQNGIDHEMVDFLKEACPQMMSVTHGQAKSILPYFPGYKYEFGKSTYRGEEVGEGGYVYAEPGMYENVALLDIASMHPHSLIAECLFGVEFTKAFRDIVEGRVCIKHEAWEIVNGMLDGKLTKFIQKVLDGEMTATDLANALKTAINSVYGLTSAKFDNPFKDNRNVDNIVAKRGALFMIDLKHEVQARGFTVAHIKTDSIKIPDATPEIIEFATNFGEQYGYTFEHEATYEKMCLVNNAVYIAKYKDGKHAGEWTATGKQFAVPYVFKTLFSKEPIVFKDMCETMSVTTALHLDMNEKLPDVTTLKSVKAYRNKYPDWTMVGIDAVDKASKILKEYNDISDDELDDSITKGHDYHFIGKIGSFCPITPGCGGGELMRQGVDKEGNLKYSAATGSKGYRWLESEMVKALSKEKDIDKNYYMSLVNDAVETIDKYGDFEWFVSNDANTSDEHKKGE